jgi:hypothetical protein
MLQLDRAFRIGCLLAMFLGSCFALEHTALPDLAVTGGISSHSIRQDELLQFTLTIKNKAEAKTPSSISLHSLRLLRVPDSYALDENQGLCVFPPLPPRHDYCEASASAGQPRGVLADVLAPGESLTVQGYLRPTAVHKTSVLTVVVGWTIVDSRDPSIQVSSSLPVSLGENQVQSTHWIRWPTFEEFMKILAIPVLLVLVGALIGFILDQVNKNRDARLANAERDRETIRRQAEEAKETDRRKHDQDQSVRAETWNQMLPIVHKYTTECYLPLSSAADRMRTNVQLWQADPRTATQRVAFFYLLFVGKKMAITRDTVGGFYFKDLRGEMLASECWRRHRRALLGREYTPFNVAVKAAVGLLDDRETYQTFEKKFAGKLVPYADENIQQAWDRFREWLRRKSRVNYAMQHLLGFCLILDYELNRPYDYWYNPPAQLVLTPGDGETTARIAAKSDYTQQQVDEYFAEVIRRKK